MFFFVTFVLMNDSRKSSSPVFNPVCLKKKKQKHEHLSKFKFKKSFFNRNKLSVIKFFQSIKKRLKEDKIKFKKYKLHLFT